LSTSPNVRAYWDVQIEEDEMSKACCMQGEKKNAYRVLVGKARMKETTRKT
jgi:hypothetical protein